MECLGAGLRIARRTFGYEPNVILFHYPAIKLIGGPIALSLSHRGIRWGCLIGVTADDVVDLFFSRIKNKSMCQPP